ncbi:MAG: peptidase M28, partial [Nitrospinota bacterium]|nr:peptidase M28 [Nitrospinota bacterium]
GHRAVMVTDTAFFRNPHYHKSTDTLETLDI